MTPLKFAFYLTYLFLGNVIIIIVSNFEHLFFLHGFFQANTGENMTLQCFYEGDAVMFYWYKQTLGQKPRLISTFYKHDESGTFRNEFMNNPRFTLKTGNGNNHLTISDLQISDSATYYCIGCYAYDFEFVEGATISVNGSGLNIQALVHQSESETIQPGGSETLNCTVHTGTCDGEHSFYWFKNSNSQKKESNAGLIYTHGDRNDQCERKPNTQTHTCVYNLPMKNLNLSHAGTYYCAVASCGHILFGNEKKLDKQDSLNLVYFLSGALAFTTILAVLLTYAAYTMKNRNSCPCTDSQVRSSLASTPNTEGYQDSDNLHYAALRKHKVNRSTKHRDNTQSECVYSTVRQ
uniref:Ig-like domain-containing protein n=1 Tax=Lates calcarifer TaxID=8187 RepID=A0A4W6DHW5_LATCA